MPSKAMGSMGEERMDMGGEDTGWRRGAVGFAFDSTGARMVSGSQMADDRTSIGVARASTEGKGEDV